MPSAAKQYCLRAPRVPLHSLPVRLEPEGFHATFDADGLNIGAGGVSLRANVLPKIGSKLNCEFEVPGEEEQLQVCGEVIWTQQANDNEAEFGLKFRGLAQGESALLERFVTDAAPAVEEVPTANTRERSTVRLSLGDVNSAVVTDVVSSSGNGYTLEQPLPFLQLGSDVTDIDSGAPGKISDVAMRIANGIPHLVFQVEFANERGEFSDGTDTVRDEDEINNNRSVRAEAPAVQSLPVLTIPSFGLSEKFEVLRGFLTNALSVLVGGLASVGEISSNVLRATIASMKRGVMLSARFSKFALKNLRSQKVRRQAPPAQAATSTQRASGLPIRLRWVALAICVLCLGWWIHSRFFGETNVVRSVESDVQAQTPAEAPNAELEQELTAQELRVSPEQAVPSAKRAVPRSLSTKSFGYENVPNADKWVLEMSNVVERIEGTSNSSGFSVNIPNALSHTRAGPIAASHPLVSTAMIMNYGDHSELSLTFEPTANPSYRVTAVGSTIEVVVERD
ncbi:MAG: PilZ domain-containing protein [Polyangiales bacterium]